MQKFYLNFIEYYILFQKFMQMLFEIINNFIDWPHLIWSRFGEGSQQGARTKTSIKILDVSNLSIRAPQYANKCPPFLKGDIDMKFNDFQKSKL